MGKSFDKQSSEEQNINGEKESKKGGASMEDFLSSGEAEKTESKEQTGSSEKEKPAAKEGESQKVEVAEEAAAPAAAPTSAEEESGGA